MEEQVTLGHVQQLIQESMQSLGADLSRTLRSALDERRPAAPAEEDGPLRAQLQSLRQKLESASGQITELSNAKQAAEEMAHKNHLDASLSIALSPFQFVNDASRQVAFDYFRGRATRSEEGSLVAEQLPLQKYVEREMSNLTGLLAPTKHGGANASAGTTRQQSAFDLDQIRPGMTPEARAAAIAAIRSVNGQ